MFKKFSKEENFQNIGPAKSSIGKAIRQSLLDQMPNLASVIDDILPKKEPINIAKCKDHLNLVVANNEILFFQERDGPFYPTLRTLHKYPTILPVVQVDKGAIKFVIGGANIMCPGVTSAGGKLPEDLPVDTIVVIMAEGKQSALAVGKLKMSSKDIKTINKDIGIDNIHYLNDGLWKLKL